VTVVDAGVKGPLSLLNLGGQEPVVPPAAAKPAPTPATGTPPGTPPGPMAKAAP
jgi:hypothetical protein